MLCNIFAINSFIRLRLTGVSVLGTLGAEPHKRGRKTKPIVAVPPSKPDLAQRSQLVQKSTRDPELQNEANLPAAIPEEHLLRA